MLLALFASWQSGFLTGVFVSFASALCLDYFFTEPKYSLRMSSFQDVLALTSFLGVSILVCYLVRRIRWDGFLLRAKEVEQRELFELSQNILIADWKNGPEERLCQTVQDKLALKGVAFWDERSSQYWYSGNADDARESLIASFRAGKDFDLPTRQESIRILRFGTRSLGAIFFRGSRANTFFVDAVASLIANNLERLRAMRAEVLAESVATSEQLRTAVLDNLAHSVKTPLTTIAISASGLASMGNLTPLQLQFAETIEEQALTISELTTKLLRTSRLDRQDVILQRRSTSALELCEAAVFEMPRELNGERITLHAPNQPLHVFADPTVLRMAVVQLLENALKYSPTESVVNITIATSEDEVMFDVHNSGTFIPTSEQQLIFERFYRSPSTDWKAPGTGLGLSIAKRAVEMHEGRLRVSSSEQEGTTFQIALPRSHGHDH
jgi:two-component system sensor histidine kinase KdpD